MPDRGTTDEFLTINATIQVQITNMIYYIYFIFILYYDFYINLSYTHRIHRVAILAQKQFGRVICTQEELVAVCRWRDEIAFHYSHAIGFDKDVLKVEFFENAFKNRGINICCCHHKLKLEGQ